MVFIDAPKNIDRGRSAVFRATVIEPEGQPYELEWATTSQPCPPAAEVQRQASWPRAGWTLTAELMVGADVTKAPFCAWAKATDKYGASAVAAVQAEVENHAPDAVLVHSIEGAAIAGNAAIPIRTQMTFSTEKSMDLDGDKVETKAWFFVSAPTADVAFDQCPGADAEDPGKRCFTPKVAGQYVLRATVTDGFKESSATDTFDVSPGNTPIARLDLKTPVEAASYRLGETFHVSAARSSDPDPVDMGKLKAIWSEPEELTAGAPTSVAELGPCEGAPPDDEASDKMERCFVADAPGVYRVSVKVTDGTNESLPATELVFKVLGDSPPCITETSPLFNEMNPSTGGSLEEATKPFEVKHVEDDLDKYPPRVAGDEPTFVWSVRDPGSSVFRLEGHKGVFLLRTSGYRIGDEVTVRLDVFDRVTRSQPQTCTADFCKTAAMCRQRVTWQVKFNQ
jgi:hypothetical protein